MEHQQEIPACSRASNNPKSILNTLPSLSSLSSRPSAYARLRLTRLRGSFFQIFFLAKPDKYHSLTTNLFKIKGSHSLPIALIRSCKCHSSVNRNSRQFQYLNCRLHRSTASVNIIN